MAEADMLRRATSFKYRSKSNMPQLKQKFFANCKGFGYPDSAAEEVWRQIESFAEFSFCKAHSASFAVESYQSLFLKAYYPMEFMVAVINNFGGFYSHRNRELYYYELMRTGARVHPPCVNHSHHLTHIAGIDVYIGFIQIKGLEEELALRIVESRQQQGLYTDLEDLINRTGVSSTQLNLLIRSGALRFTGKTKKQLLWEGDLLLKNAAKPVVGSNTLFHTTGKNFTLPQLPEYPLDDVYDQVELLGFPVANPFVLVEDDPQRYVPAKELPAHKGKNVTVLAYHITQKPVRTVRGDVMSFGTFIDSELNWIDTVHFPEAHKLMQPQAGFYQVSGKVVEEFGVYSIEVTHIEKAGIRNRRSTLQL
jgi:DNA polymerase-3 subunit alpha